MYSESYPEHLDEYSDNEQSFDYIDKSPVSLLLSKELFHHLNTYIYNKGTNATIEQEEKTTYLY